MAQDSIIRAVENDRFALWITMLPSRFYPILRLHQLGLVKQAMHASTRLVSGWSIPLDTNTNQNTVVPRIVGLDLQSTVVLWLGRARYSNSLMSLSRLLLSKESVSRCRNSLHAIPHTGNFSDNSIPPVKLIQVMSIRRNRLQNVLPLTQPSNVVKDVVVPAHG